MNDEADIRGLLKAGTKVDVLKEMYTPQMVRDVVSKVEAEEEFMKLLADSRHDTHEFEGADKAQEDSEHL